MKPDEKVNSCRCDCLVWWVGSSMWVESVDWFVTRLLVILFHWLVVEYLICRDSVCADRPDM